jgi:hypothetical protein
LVAVSAGCGFYGGFCGGFCGSFAATAAASAGNVEIDAVLELFACGEVFSQRKSSKSSAFGMIV